MSDNIVFKAITWSYDEINEDDHKETILHVGGLTEKEESVQLVVEGFMPFYYLELPTRITWTKVLVKSLQEKLFELPLSYKFQVVDMSFKYRMLYHEKVPTWILKFPTTQCMWDFTRRLKRRWSLGYGVTLSQNELKLHETKMLDPIIKFTSLYKLPLSGWLKAKLSSTKPTATTKYSGKVLYTNLKALPLDDPRVNIRVNPLFMSFDIETYSKNHDSKDPNPHELENVIMQIAFCVGRMNQETIDKEYCLTLVSKSTETKENYKLIEFPTNIEHDDSDETKIEKIIRAERRLLLKFFDYIKRINPDVFVGYNIMKFDWPYIITRCRKPHNILNELLACGRVNDYMGTIGVIKWGSNAYGKQDYEYLQLHGRLHMDILLDIERNKKFPKYSLNYVSGEILGESKDDLTPRELFMIWQFTTDFMPMIHRGITKREGVRIIKTLTQTLMRNRQTHGIVLKYRDRMIRTIKKKKYNKLEKLGSRLMGIMADYCVQDTRLPIKLCHHLNLWDTAVSMSKIMCIPISYLTTRGQQIRVVSQVTRACIPEAIFIQRDGYPSRKFQGATVVEVNPSHQRLVFTLDFSSLYPSLQQGLNLCQVTLLRDGQQSQLNTNDYREFEVKEHVGCPHDPLRRRKKKEDVFCMDNTYRFRRVKYEIDENGEYKVKYMGIVPTMIQNLLAVRRQIKKDMGYHYNQANELKKKLESDPDGINADEIKKQIKYHEEEAKNKNVEQLAVKTSNNSVYGASATKDSVLSCIPIAAVITAMGRRYLIEAIKEIQSKIPNIKLIYGDSVPGYTPVLVRYYGAGGFQTLLPIETLFRPSNYSDIEGKDVHFPNQLEVWSDKGFTKVNKVIRHKTTKLLYRVTTSSGMVVVTEDHSLLLEDSSCIAPKNLKIGQRLLHRSLPVAWKNHGNEPFNDFGWTCGIFYSCGHYDSDTKSWSVRHDEQHILVKWINTLDFLLGKLSIKKTNHIRPYSLTFPHSLINYHPILGIIANYGNLIIPCVTGYSQSFWISFLQGLMDGSGCYSNGGCYRNSWSFAISKYYVQPHLDAARIMWIAESLGYSCYVQVKEYDMLVIHMKEQGSSQYDHKVGEVIDIVPIKYDGYVYDLETHNHHFHAGAGSLIVHNTDSCMLVAEGRSREESYKIAQQASKIATHKIKCLIVGIDTEHVLKHKHSNQTFTLTEMNPSHPEFKNIVYSDQCICIEYHQCPMELTFENMYDQFFLRTKKRYTAYPVDANGNRQKKTVKGVITARRDNAAFSRKVYDDVDEAILADKSFDETMEIIQRHLINLYSFQIPHSQFVIYKGMKKSVMEYAKHVKEKNENGDEKFKYYVDKDGNPINDPIGPLDPRLVYKNDIQSHLGLKMIRRGVILPANYRLEYIHLDLPGCELNCEKVEDYGYFLEHYRDQGWSIDVDYYAHTLMGTSEDKQVAEMLKIKYPGEVVYQWGPWADEVQRLLDLWIRDGRDILNEDEHQVLYTLQYITSFTCKLVACDVFSSTTVIIEKQWVVAIPILPVGSEPVILVRHAVVGKSKLLAKLSAILSLSNHPTHSLWVRTPWPVGNMSLYQAAHRYKSMLVINQLHRNFGCPKRAWSKGKYDGWKNLPIPKEKQCKMMTKTTIGSIPPLTKVLVVSREEIPEESNIKTVSKFTYTIHPFVGGDRIINDKIKESNVLRESLMTFYDSRQRALSRLIEYHQCWRQINKTLAIYRD